MALLLKPQWEYLLLIMVIIAIALGIGGPLGRHLRDFSGAILGPSGYYACLTKKGLLPGDVSPGGGCGNYSDLALNYLGDISSGKAFPISPDDPGGAGPGQSPGSTGGGDEPNDPGGSNNTDEGSDDNSNDDSDDGSG